MRLALPALFIACGARTGLDVPHTNVDASVEPDVATKCDFGNVVSDISGNVVSWNGGAPLPAGHYRVTYVDGCMKYSSAQDWSVNAYAGDGPDEFWIVTGSSQNRITSPPGTVGFLVNSGGFATFDQCVQANKSIAPVTFDFVGGPLGVWLADSPYTDNVAGENGRNPTWHLSSCP